MKKLKNILLHHLSWLALSDLLLFVLSFTGWPSNPLDVNLGQFYFVFGMKIIFRMLSFILLICIGLQVAAGENWRRFMRVTFLPLNVFLFIQVLIYLALEKQRSLPRTYDLSSIDWRQLQMNTLMFTFLTLLFSSLLLALVHGVRLLLRRR